MIMVTLFTTSYYAVEQIKFQESESGPGYQAINQDMFWSMVGFSFYLFEAIGCLLPILRETEHPENFAWLTFAALWSICLLQIGFSSLCYYAWGSDIKEPLITELLPSANVWI